MCFINHYKDIGIMIWYLTIQPTLNKTHTSSRPISDQAFLVYCVLNTWVSGLSAPRKCYFKSVSANLNFLRYAGLLNSNFVQIPRGYVPWLTDHNWQKWKRVFLTCLCHKMFRVEAVGLKSSNYTWKIMIFGEHVKFGAISWKIDILSITA